jgi:hypothetical protein
MGFFKNLLNKPTTDPKKQFKKLKKYCMQVLGMNEEDAEKKANEWLWSRDKKIDRIDD